MASDNKGSVSVALTEVRDTDHPQRRANDLEKHTGLLDLPPELWSKIGKLVIDDSNGVTDRILKFGIRWDEALSPYQPAITRTCRSLRAELLPYFLKTKVASILRPFPSQLGKFATWLNAMVPDMRRHVRGVRVRVVDDDDIDWWCGKVEEFCQIRATLLEEEKGGKKIYQLRLE